MKTLGLVLMIAVAVAALFFIFKPKVVIIIPSNSIKNGPGLPVSVNLQSVPESEISTSSFAEMATKNGNSSADISNQQPLSSPPATVKGVYVTAWSAGSPTKINSLISLINKTELNTVVIDIKDYSGHVSYKTGVAEVASSGAENEIRILRPNALIKKLHDANIYVIGRITVFQDPILAKAHPEWALKNKLTGKTWTDNKGLAWMDPAAKPVWNYDIAIAKDALARGFDEINFDYIRFASDGSLGQIEYPFWDQKTPRATVIKNFFKYLRENLTGQTISADLFGLSTIDTWDDLGIGQVIENAYRYFDYVSPMVYPSHYAPGTLGYKQPAKYPYEVVKYSMDRALGRLIAKDSTQDASSSAAVSSTESQGVTADTNHYIAKLRPWLQDFSLGTTYDANMVRKQITATYDALINVSSTRQGNFGGWLLWSAANTYTETALQPKQ